MTGPIVAPPDYEYQQQNAGQTTADSSAQSAETSSSESSSSSSFTYTSVPYTPVAYDGSYTAPNVPYTPTTYTPLSAANYISPYNAAPYTPATAATGGVDPFATVGGATADGTGSGTSQTTQAREYSFDQLMANLDMSRYQPLTDAELTAEARGLYDPVYNAEREGMAQQAERNQLQLDQELRGLTASYDRARADTATSFAQAYSDAGNAMLSRGMQRSSYGQQVQSNIQIAGGRAQQDINQAQAAQEADIRETASMYDRQFQESLTRLATDYETNVMNIEAGIEGGRVTDRRRIAKPRGCGGGR